MVWELFFKLTEKRPVDNPVGCSDTTGLHRIKQTVPYGKVLPFRKVLPDKTKLMLPHLKESDRNKDATACIWPTWPSLSTSENSPYPLPLFLSSQHRAWSICGPNNTGWQMQTKDHSFLERRGVWETSQEEQALNSAAYIHTKGYIMTQHFVTILASLQAVLVQMVKRTVKRCRGS